MAEEVYRSAACSNYDCLKCLQMDCQCTCHILEDVCDLIAAGVEAPWPPAPALESVPMARAVRRAQARTAASAAVAAPPEGRGSALPADVVLPAADPECEFDYVEVSDLIDAANWEGWSAGIP